MPSPIAHLSVGVSLFMVVRSYRPRLRHVFLFFWATLLFVMVPDVDAILGILLGNLGAYHNQGTHSLGMAVIFCGIGATILKPVFGLSWKRLFVFFLLCNATHLLMDWMTWGRGIKLFWPISDKRFLSPFLAFYGLHYSDPLSSPKHLVTLATEGLFAISIIGLTAACLKAPQFQKTEQIVQ